MTSPRISSDTMRALVATTRQAARWIALAATVGMFLVLVMGATVTNTGSAEGCGRSWPLCNGQFVPEFTVATAIEYSHRAVTGVETLLILALVAAMLTLRRPGDRELWALAGLMLGTLFLQAGLGAAAVLAPQSPFILATHFGVSLAAFAATYLSAVLVFERTGVEVAAQPRRRTRAAPIGITLYLATVVYLGAYLRHAGISLACADWPLCNGEVVPVLEGPTAFVFAHRVAAVGALALLGWLAVVTRRWAAYAAFGLCVLQTLSGALVVWTRVGLFGALAHAAIVALLFAAVAHLLRATWLGAHGNNFGADRETLSDGAARGLQPSDAATAHTHVLATTAPPLGKHPGRRAVADDSRG